MSLKSPWIIHINYRCGILLYVLYREDFLKNKEIAVVYIFFCPIHFCTVHMYSLLCSVVKKKLTMRRLCSRKPPSYCSLHRHYRHQVGAATIIIQYTYRMTPRVQNDIIIQWNFAKDIFYRGYSYYYSYSNTHPVCRPRWAVFRPSFGSVPFSYNIRTRRWSSLRSPGWTRI